MAASKAPASYANVYELVAELRLSEPACRRAFELARLSPGRDEWLRYLDFFLIAVGTALIVVGVVAFFAWNWADLGHFAKFTLIQAGIVAAVIAAWRLGIDNTAGRAGLLTGAVLVGVLLAVFGQVYQTGADPYGLFLAWAILILPWAIIGRQAGLWMLFQALLNLAFIMYWTQVRHPPSGLWDVTRLLGPLVWLGSTVTDWRLASWLFALNIVALVIWEYAAARGIGWMRDRWFPRLFALIALGTVLAPTLLMIFGAAADVSIRLSIVSPLLFVAAMALCLYYYQYRKHDLFILTACVLAAIMVITSLGIRHLSEGPDTLLLIAVLLIAQVAGAAYWLRTVANRWEVES